MRQAISIIPAQLDTYCQFYEAQKMRKTLERSEFRVSYSESLALFSAEGPPVLDVYVWY
jgi:hypothetical protein